MSIEFEHITIPSSDLEASIAFYTTLGMQLIEWEAAHHAHFENIAHQVIFTAYYNLQMPDYTVKVYFEVDNLARYKALFPDAPAYFAKYGTPTGVTPENSSNWNESTLCVDDPDGNQVTLYERFSKDAITPWENHTQDKNHR